jgi:UDP-glucose 4-epimerase
MSELVLVTGGAGFIGSHLVGGLLSAGYRVRVLDNFSTGHRENLAPVLDEIELLEGDVCDPAAVERAVAGVTFVLHQAALPSVPRSIKDPLLSDRTNVGGTVAVLDAARRARVERVVYASSSSVYGDSPTLPKHEDMTPQPKSPYAVSKLAGEHYLRVFYDTYGLETVALRYFNVFGPRQDPTSQYSGVIARFCMAALAGQPCTIFGDGAHTRDFTYVTNVVQANLAALTAPAAQAAGRVMNVACGDQITLLELVATLGDLVGRELPVEFAAARPGDILHSRADIERARRVLGYETAVTFREGLDRTLAWYEARPA